MEIRITLTAKVGHQATFTGYLNGNQVELHRISRALTGTSNETNTGIFEDTGAEFTKNGIVMRVQWDEASQDTAEALLNFGLRNAEIVNRAFSEKYPAKNEEAFAIVPDE